LDKKWQFLSFFLLILSKPTTCKLLYNNFNIQSPQSRQFACKDFCWKPKFVYSKLYPCWIYYRVTHKGWDFNDNLKCLIKTKWSLSFASVFALTKQIRTHEYNNKSEQQSTLKSHWFWLTLSIGIYLLNCNIYFIFNGVSNTSGF